MFRRSLTPVQDLSKVHHSVSELFVWPSKASDWDQYRLKPEQIEFFHEYGWLAGVPILEEMQIEKLKEELQDLMDPEHPGHALFYEFHLNESSDTNTILFHSLGAWRIAKGFHDLLWNPAIAMAASQLLDDHSVRFWHDQLFSKPAKKGGVVAWHQDYSYWTRTKPMAHITCWCSLDDSTVENGCLQYVSGSHKWGLLDKPELAGDLFNILDYLSPEQKAAFKPVSVETKAGQAIFHHPLTLHGSGENKSQRQRRAFVINAFADGVKSDSDQSLLEGVPVISRGHKMEGQFFPLIFEGPRGSLS